MKRLLFCGIFMAGMLGAQEFSRYTFSAGAGFTTPVGTTGQNVDIGWNIKAGGGMNFSSRFGVNLDAGFDVLGVSAGDLNYLWYGSGSLTVFSLTLDPIVHLTPKGPVDVYVTGGGGYFHQNLNFKDGQPYASTVTLPFFSYLPTSPMGNSFYGTAASNKPGIDAGIGVEFGHKWGGKFFAEARYDRIFTGNYHTDYIPVTFGFRK
jgi:hypothetical protein